MSRCINVKPKAIHQELNAQTPRACEPRFFFFSGTRRPFGGLGNGPRRPPRWGPPFRPATRGPGEPGASSRVILSSLRLESWTLQPRVLLAAGRPGPCGHIIPGRGCARSGRPRRHRATSVPPGRASREAPCPEPPRGWACAGSGRDPGGDPERSLGPAGRRRRAGCGETIICSVVMRR